jgi:predicted DNA-binding transcriptional regulator AlpA
MRTSSKLLTQIEAAKVLGVDRTVLRAATRAGCGPPPLRLGKRFYYPMEAITRWLKGVSRAAAEAAKPAASKPAAVVAPVEPKPAPAAPTVRKPEKPAPDLSCYGEGLRQVRTVVLDKAARQAAGR